MIDLYKREEIELVKKEKKKHIAISVSIFAFALIIFVLFLVFTTRENKTYHLIANAIISSLIICFGYAYLSFKVSPLNKELKFIKHIPLERDNKINVESFEITEEIVIKYSKVFQIFKCNGFEYLIDITKIISIPSKIKSITINGRFVTKIEDINDEKQG